MNGKRLLRISCCLIFLLALIACQLKVIEYFRKKEISEWLLSQKLTVTVGDTVECGELLTGSGYSAGQLSWSVDGSSVYVMDSSTLICEASGMSVVTAMDKDRKIAECSVDVTARSVITMESDFAVIGEGLTVDISASVVGEHSGDFIYESENSTIATVDENGTVSALSSGDAKIKVSSYGCDSVYYTVSVSKSPYTVTLSAQEIKLGAGESTMLSASLPDDSYGEIAPSFSSSDETVATVDKNGLITAVATGKCKITATAYSGACADCSVEVGKAPKSLTVQLKKKSLYAGETTAITASINNDSVCNGYTFSSSDTSVATVSDNGVITGKGRGNATITVSTYNGKKASCNVSVQIVDYMTSPTSQDVYDMVGYLAQFYPNLISTEVIGSSVKGKDIMLLKLGNGDKKACIVAGLHAKEDVAVVFTLRSIEEYAAAYYSSSGKYGSYNMKKMLDEYTLYIVPTMNPDGLDIVNAGEMPLYTDKLSDSVRVKYKSNANGVNLNRNFPFRWDKTISSAPEPDEATYKGAYEASEPETQVIVKLVENNDFEWLFSMHCKGNFVYWADQYNKITNNDRKLANRLESVCGYSLKGASPIENLGGGLENWFRYKTGNPGFCVELVGSDYSSEVNKYFSLKTNWSKTRYTFAQGMR